MVLGDQTTSAAHTGLAAAAVAVQIPLAVAAPPGKAITEARDLSVVAALVLLGLVAVAALVPPVVPGTQLQPVAEEQAPPHPFPVAASAMQVAAVAHQIMDQTPVAHQMAAVLGAPVPERLAQTARRIVVVVVVAVPIFRRLPVAQAAKAS